MNDIILKGFLGHKDDTNSERYNFDLTPLIKYFNFYDFCDEVKETEQEHGGILVISNKQYIFKYITYCCFI